MLIGSAIGGLEHDFGLLGATNERVTLMYLVVDSSLDRD